MFCCRTGMQFRMRFRRRMHKIYFQKGGAGMAQGHIDVVSDFIYDASNQQYNRAYKFWRKNTPSAGAYRYIDNERESVFVSGKPSARSTAAQTEKRALSFSAEVIGAALLVLLVCALGGSSLLIWILRQFGVNIQLDFLTLSMRGNQWTVTAVRALSEMLKFGIPLIVLMRFFRLPPRVVLPHGFGGLSPLIAAIGFGAVCSACYALTAHTGAIETMQGIYSYKDPEAVLAYALFDIVFVSVISELLLRGAILPVLRQFGDLFAVGITACIGFLIPAGLSLRLSELMIGLTAGYLLLRSGSVWNCIILRVIFSSLEYARLWVVYANGSLSLAGYVLLLLGGGGACVLIYVLRRHRRLLLANRHTALTLREKLLAFSQTVTSLPWLAASALLALLQLFY